MAKRTDPLLIGPWPLFFAMAVASCAEPAPPAPAAPLVASAAPPPPAAAHDDRLAYPVAAKGDQVDDYHGTKVKDPYRWLESLDSPETRAWVEAENRVTFGYLDKIPSRKAIHDRMTELWNYERYSPPFREGDRYFFTRNTGLQNQSVVYTAHTLESEPAELLDPNTLAADGTIALAGLDVSNGGKLVAYGVAAAGLDWQDWHVRDVATGQDRPDVLHWVKFTEPAWTHDDKGLFYGRYPEPKAGMALEEANYYNKLYFHKLGTPQAEDTLIYERPDEKEWEFVPNVTEDGRYLIITVAKGTDDKYMILYRDLLAKAPRIMTLIDKFESEYGFLANDGPVFYFKSNHEAPKGKVIAIDTRRPEPVHWRTIVPEAADNLDHVSCVHDELIASYLKDAHTTVKVFDLTGKLRNDVALPGLGTASGWGGRRNQKETFYSFTSFSRPDTVYRLDLDTFKSTVWKAPKLAFNPDDYETRQDFFASKDGTKIPIFVTTKKGVSLDGKNPTLLYGYGGFNVSLTPAFSVTDLVFLEQGGVYAVANLRGGGEYGEEWHRAGTKLHKQTVFDDFIAAAEWLIHTGYTSSRELAIQGGSNGGLLVGAVVTQRPDLFAAALPAVGVMDMLRFHKFTIGHGWVDDFGSSDDAEEFKALYAYSPLHNIKSGASYPAMLITTGDHDDRVVPGHSFKFAAAMQAAQSGDNPVLIRIETRAGHGAGKPVGKRIDESTDQLAFLHQALKMDAAR